MRNRRGGIDGLLIALVSAGAILTQADLEAPPRYDGAGYAVLARSLMEGRGYRAIDHPDGPRHAHFPPGYPAFLAAVWGVAGESDRAAHLASTACAVGATLAAWLWFRTLYARPVAAALSLALAVNWAWARVGSGIQSEPLYQLLGWLALLIVAAKRPREDLLRGVSLGLTLAAATLTRQAGLALAAASAVEVGVRGNRRAIAGTALAFGVLLAPWLAWSAVVSRDDPDATQAGMFLRAVRDLPTTVPAQVAFYAGRIPDQLTAPAVEVATVFGRSPAARWAAVGWGAAATAVVLAGWVATLRGPKRRIAGLVGFATLGLLVAWPYTEAGRFLVPLIPALLVGAAEGLARGAARAGVVRPRRARTYAAWLLVLAATPYAAYSVATAERRLKAERDPAFEAACAWLRDEARRPGPVLTRHPGELFLRTGRHALEVPTAERPGAVDAAPEAVAEAIRRYGAAYIVVDSGRYANATASPLARFASERPGDVREVFMSGARGGVVRVFEVTAPE